SDGNSWLLWGDSHGAHLYPGIEAHYGRNTVVQRTASGCPPIQGQSYQNRPECPAITEYVWQEIETHRPARVTLAGRWDAYDWQEIRQTVGRLRALGVAAIDLVGPVPQWRNGLPRQLAIAYRESGFRLIPE